jgi:hypothetical protein
MCLKIIVKFQEALSPNIHESSTLNATLFFPPLKTVSRATTTKMAHRRISQDMLLYFVAQRFLEDGLAGVYKFCCDLGILI